MANCHRLRSTSYQLIQVISCILLLCACSSKPISNEAGLVPRHESPSPYGNPSSYVIFGKTYRVMQSSKGYSERGMASWYGPTFHGKRASSGTTYNMHNLSAAHKTLPIPTYVRVTNLENNKSLIVRVDDRGPFAHDRIIDLSKETAQRLGVIQKGTAQVEVTALEPYQDLSRPRIAPSAATIAAAPLATGYAISAAEPTYVDHTAPQHSISPNPNDDTNQPALSLSASPIMTSQPQPAMTAALPLPSTPTVAGYYLQLGAFSTESNAQLLAQRTAYLGSRVTPIDHLYKVIAGPLASPQLAEQTAQQLAEQGFDKPKILMY